MIDSYMSDEQKRKYEEIMRGAREKQKDLKVVFDDRVREVARIEAISAARALNRLTAKDDLATKAMVALIESGERDPEMIASLSWRIARAVHQAGLQLEVVAKAMAGPDLTEKSIEGMVHGAYEGSALDRP